MKRTWTVGCSAVFALALSWQALVVPTSVGAQSQATPVYRDASRPASERAHDLVQRMTLDEKAAQLEDWATAIPRLGVPDYQTWSEALHGVARAGHATVFPQAIGMAATWDTEMVKQMGDVISTEARGKYNEAQREGNHRIFWGLTFWSPNINIFRDPRWGRGQETYGEDPFLTGRMGIAFIQGVQGPDAAHPKAVATSKHFAVHSGPESLRHGFDVKVSPRDLEETYLPAFRATVTEGDVKSVMCAYNAVDGMGACASKLLLDEHLRQAWGFKGFVVSDCGAIVDVTEGHKNAPDIMHASVMSLEAGTDLSCSIWRPGFNTLADAVRKGLVTEDLVTRAAERLYTSRFELGLFDEPGANPNDKIGMDQVASQEHRAMALKAAEESIVLLKNDGVLPLKNAKTIAVVGPTAELIASLEGNYNGQPVHPVTPLEGIMQQFGPQNVHYAQGASLAVGAGAPVPRTAFEGGLKAEYFATPDWTGRPVATSMEPRIDYDWVFSTPVPEIHTHDYSVRWSGTIRVPAPGKYHFSTVTSSGFPYSPHESYHMMVDGKVVSEGKTEGEPKPAQGVSPSAPPVMVSMAKGSFEVTFNDTNPHAFEFAYSHSGDSAGGGITLNWEAPADAQIAEAVNVAKSADAVVAFTGLSPNLEGEEMPIKIEGFSGGDRTSIDLPAPQRKLIEAVAATGKPLILVNLSGSAVALNNQQPRAILQAWYPGVDGGTAIAKTLAGESNPAGRLPVTFYAGVQDLPAFTEYSMKNRTYRYYTGKPLWGFGYGLSYSTFKYGDVKLSTSSVEPGKPVTATVTVTNTSQAAGDEVVEAYLKSPQQGGPVHSLVGFQRVHLNPGESRDVTIEVSPRSLSSVDDNGKRSILAGQYRLTLGSTQPQETKAKSEATFTVKGTVELPK